MLSGTLRAEAVRSFSAPMFKVSKFKRGLEAKLAYRFEV